MKRKSFWWIVSLAICFSLFVASNLTLAYAGTEDAVKGDKESIMEYDDYLDEEESWTYELNLVRPAVLDYYITSDEGDYVEAEFSFTIKNNDTGEYICEAADFVNEDYYYSDEDISLAPGSYTICFTHECYDCCHFYLDVGCQQIYGLDDPYYHIVVPGTGVVYKGKTMQLKAEVLPQPLSYTSVKWSSSNSSVATVDANGLVKGVAKGTATIKADIDGHICKTTIYVHKPEYELNHTTVTLWTGKTKDLNVSVFPADYGLKGLKWTSSNTAVASVNRKGLVTAKKAGMATITATVNGKTLKCKVTVKAVKLNKSTATIYVKKTKQLKLEGVTGKVSWKSSNKNVATVSEKGVVKGIKPGTATITATKNGKKYTCKVTIKWAPETGVKKVYKLNYPNGESGTIKTITCYGKTKIEIEVKNKSDSSYGDNVYVTLDDEDYTTLASKFIDAGKTGTIVWNAGVGKYDLYCSCDDSFSVKITTTTKPALSRTSITMGKGTNETIKVVGVKNGGKWSSSDKSIVTVSSKGVITGKKKGTCYIKYTLKTGKVLKCKVTVVNPITAKVVYVDDTSIYNECGVRFTNYTKKKITYIEYNIKQYDNRGYRLEGPFSSYNMNADLPARSYTTREAWVDDSAKKCSVYIMKVYFADGTTWTP